MPILRILRIVLIILTLFSFTTINILYDTKFGYIRKLVYNRKKVKY